MSISITYPNDQGLMNCSYRQERSFTGKTIDVIKSALQKYIRRDEQSKLTRLVGEIDLFCHSSDKRNQAILTNIYHRIMIIWLEDIGMPGVSYTKQFVSLLEQWNSLRKQQTIKNFEQRTLSLFHLIQMTFNVHRSRSFSHIRSVWMNDDDHQFLYERFPVLQTIDQHKKSVNCTDWLDSLQKSDYVVFYQLWKLLQQNEKTTTTAAYFRSKKYIFYIFAQLVDCLEKKDKWFGTLMVEWYKELGTLKEASLCWMILVQIILDKKSLDQNKSVTLSDTFVCEYQDFELDDYVYDKHTKGSKGNKRTISYFVNVSSDVTNEDPQLNQEYKQIYIAKKSQLDTESEHNAKQSSVRLFETDVFTYLARSQLTTGMYKTDTYLAVKRSSNERVFVKGPFLDTKQVDLAVKINQFKQNFVELYCLEMEKKELIPNIFESCPLGMRKLIEPNKLYSFMIMEDLTTFPTDTPIPTYKKASKLWPEQNIVDWSTSKSKHLDETVLMKPVVIQKYILNLCFRHIVGISDCAMRNFIVLPSFDVVSIDEDIAFKPSIKLEHSVSNQVIKLIRDFINSTFKSNIDRIISLWKQQINTNIISEYFDDQNEVEFIYKRLTNFVVENILE